MTTMHIIFYALLIYQFVGIALLAWFDKDNSLLDWLNEGRRISMLASLLVMLMVFLWPITLGIYLRRKRKPKNYNE